MKPCHWIGQDDGPIEGVSFDQFFFVRLLQPQTSTIEPYNSTRMVESTTMDEPSTSKRIHRVLPLPAGFALADRSSKRPSRSSTLKPKPSVEVKVEVPVDIPDEDEDDDTEDPPELYQKGDLIWLHVAGNPWWPALIYGRHCISCSPLTIRRLQVRTTRITCIRKSFEGLIDRRNVSHNTLLDSRPRVRPRGLLRLLLWTELRVHVVE